VDLDQLLMLARSARHIEVLDNFWEELHSIEPQVKIAVAVDEAFTFYYEDNLDMLRACGAELAPFSPLSDTELPPGTHGIYLGGGFPELYVEQLSGNKEMHSALQFAHASGTPIYAECGGYMYLMREIVDFEGDRHPMSGLVPAVAMMEQARLQMGYVEAQFKCPTVLGAVGSCVQGHEFHRSRIDNQDEPWPAAYMLKPHGSERDVGYAAGGLLGSYVHIHFASNPALAAHFIHLCAGAEV
jgi:cobyrinic acid a,c-diamide synthase